MDQVFADASGFIAALSARDKDHDTAAKTYRRLLESKIQVVTTNHVFDETCNWMLRYGDLEHKSAVSFGRFVFENFHASHTHAGPDRTPANTYFLIVYATPDLERRAWAIFEQYDTAGFSFTDCVSFAVMEALGIKKAFAFDTHFDQMGFDRL